MIASPALGRPTSGSGGVTRDRWRRFFRAHCADDVRRLVEAYPDERSLHVDVLDLYEFDESFTQDLLADPDRFLRAGADALADLHESFDRVNLRLTNNPGLLGVDALRSRHVSELVTIEGVVTAIDEVQSAVEEAVYRCGGCGNRVRREPGRRPAAPPRCAECGLEDAFGLDVDRSTFVDVQRIRLEAATGAEPDGGPSEVDALVDDDLVGTPTLDEPLLVTGIVDLEPAGPPDRYDLSLEIVSMEGERGSVRLGDDDVPPELKQSIR